MPKVPIYDSFQVAPQATPGAMQSGAGVADIARTAGAQEMQLGKAMLGLGDQLTANDIARQIDLNEAAAKTADNAVADSLRELLHNPETGYMHKSGKTAVDGYKPTAEAIDAAIKSAGNALENDQQREAFRNAALRRRQQALTTVETHAAQQTKQYNIDATVARIGSNERDMVTTAPAWKVPGSAFAQADATRKAEIEDFIAQKFGANADPAIKDAARLELNTRAHIAILDEMLSKHQVKDAQEYFAAKLREIDPEKQDNVRKALDTAGRQNTVLAYSDTLLATVKGYGAQMKQVQADFEAGKIDGKEREAIESRLDHKRQVALSQQAEGEKYALGAAFDFLQKNPGKTADDLPPAIYRNVLTHLPSLRSFAAAEGKTTTDPTVYYDLRLKAADDPVAFSKTNLLKYRELLSQPDWKHLVELQGSITKSDAKAIAAQRMLSSTLKAINAELAAAGIDVTPNPNTDKGKKQAENLAKLNTSLLHALDNEQTAKGRQLTFDEQRKIGLDQLKQGWLQGSGIFFNDKMRRYAVPPEARYQAHESGKDAFVETSYADIPYAIRTEMESSIQGRGRVPTKAEVERMYQRAKDQGVIKP